VLELGVLPDLRVQSNSSPLLLSAHIPQYGLGSLEGSKSQSVAPEGGAVGACVGACVGGDGPAARGQSFQPEAVVESSEVQ